MFHFTSLHLRRVVMSVNVLEAVGCVKYSQPFRVQLACAVCMTVALLLPPKCDFHRDGQLRGEVTSKVVVFSRHPN